MSGKHNYRLDFATYAAAKYACERWHYSKCIPSTLQKIYAIGLWENDIFSGVIIYGHGANPQIGSPYNLNIYEVCELTRIAMKPNHLIPVSKFISLSIKLFLKKSFPKMRLIVSYADEGQDHHGGVYQASNWIYVGKSPGVPSLFYKGKKWHAKALRTSFPKLKHSDPSIKKMPATDKHKYLMPLDNDMKNKILKLSKKYPKRAASIDNDAPSDQLGEGGAIPTAALHSKQAVLQDDKIIANN